MNPKQTCYQSFPFTSVLFRFGFFLFLFCLVSPRGHSQDLKVYDQPTLLKFENGCDVVDNTGKLLKSMPGYQEASIQAYEDTRLGRLYMTDWSYNRWQSEGKLPNWIRPKAAPESPRTQPNSLPPKPPQSKTQTSPKEKRVAILIGNSEYPDASLANPVNDIRDLSALFSNAGFETLTLLDAKGSEMHEALQSKKASISKAKCVVYFFAGHGFQASGSNYMVPVDFPLDELSSESFAKGVTLDSVLTQLESSTSSDCVKMVILDCCRNNPFTDSASQGGRSIVGGKRIAKGLAAPARTPRGTILCFSTDPGEVALDGAGQRNSPYAAALKTHLFDQGVEINEALRRAGNLVQRSTGQKQNPWRNTNFNGEFYVVPTPSLTYNTRMSIVIDRDNERIHVKFVTPLAVDLSGIAGDQDGKNLLSENVITIPSITAKGLVSPSHDPNDDSGFQNEAGTLFGFNLRPATKTSYPYAFYRDQNGQIHMIDNLLVRIARVLPEKDDAWKGYFEDGGYLQMESIRKNNISFYSHAWVDSNQVKLRFTISVDSRGNLTYVN